MDLPIIDGDYEACHDSDLDTLRTIGSKRPSVLTGAWTPCRLLVLCLPMLLFVPISNSRNDPDTLRSVSREIRHSDAFHFGLSRQHSLSHSVGHPCYVSPRIGLFVHSSL